jgi:cytochrome c oxidase assembly factor CtaG
VVHPGRLVFDPEWAIAIAIALLDYLYVVRVLGRRGSPTPRLRRASFVAGLALIAVALFSPLEHLALTSMLSFHLLQNVMLADWAPPLLVAGLSAAMVLGAERRQWVRWATTPAVALVWWLAVWYTVHVPAFYDYALHYRWALGAEHVLLLSAGLVFWWPVLSPDRMQSLPKLVYLLAAFFLAAPLALVLALSQTPVYAFYEHTPKLWGLSALEDQQLGAITMSVEQAVILFAACSIVFGRLLEHEGEDELGLEPLAPCEPHASISPLARRRPRTCARWRRWWRKPPPGAPIWCCCRRSGTRGWMASSCARSPRPWTAARRSTPWPGGRAASGST